MGGRGWSGDPPRDDSEARERIVRAASRCIAQFGPAKTSLTDVASELGVTRQTVYRHFPTTSSLLNAVAVVDSAAFLDRVEKHKTESDDPVEIVAEMVVFSMRALREEWFLSQSLTEGAVTPLSIGFTEQLLRRLSIDWDATEVGPDLTSFAELVLRVLLSFMHNPSNPPRSDPQLKAWVAGWLRPVMLGAPTPNR